MGKDKNRQNPQQMGTKGNLQQKQPIGKENLNPAGLGQQQVNRNLNTQKPAVGGSHMGGQAQQKQPYIKKDPWKDTNK